MAMVSSLVLCLVVGPVLFFIGILREKKDYQLTTVGLALTGLPIGIVLLMLIGDALGDLLTSKPNAKDLIGTYHIVKVTNLDFDETTYRNYSLRFYENGSFSLTPTPRISVCDSGNYAVDYIHDYNELCFECHGGFIPVHIDRGFGSFRIDFIIGDPDSGESIYFAKDGD